MIELKFVPQRSTFAKVNYTINDDILIVELNHFNLGTIIEEFDFTGLPEGIAEEIIPEKLPFNPIFRAEKVGNTIIVTVPRLYGIDEKELFENG